jgi:altronate dehydratase large subunit
MLLKRISAAAGAPGFIHAKGTDGEVGIDAEITRRTLINVALNPNVYAVLFVGLGDERFNAQDLSELVEEKKPSKWLHIHSLGESGGHPERF